MGKAESAPLENPEQPGVVAAAEMIVDHSLPFEKARHIAARVGKYIIFGLAANGAAFGGLTLAPYLQSQSGESEPG
jgi:hypothetical protein